MQNRHFPIMRRNLLIGLALGVLMAVGIVVLRLGPWQAFVSPPNALGQIIDSIPAPNTPLTSSSTPEEVIGLMLHSHITWHTLQGEATISWLNTTTGAFETRRETVELEQFGKFRIEIGPEGGPASFVWVSDGVNIWEVDYAHKTKGHGQVPPEARSLQTYGPPDLPTDFGPIAIQHPVASLMHTMVADYIFPLGMAQGWRYRTLTILGVETVAGRDAVKVLVQQFANDGTVMTGQEVFWIDAVTGVVLKGQEFMIGEDGSLTLMTEIFFSSVTYNAPLPAGRFADPRSN